MKKIFYILAAFFAVCNITTAQVSNKFYQVTVSTNGVFGPYKFVGSGAPTFSGSNFTFTLPSYVAVAGTSSNSIHATTANNSSNLVGNVPTTPIDIGSIGGSNTLDFATGAYQSATLTNTLVLLPPTNGIHGSRLEFWCKGGITNMTLGLDATITIPSDSAVSFPKTITSNLTYIIILRNSSNNWWLTSLVGGF